MIITRDAIEEFPFYGVFYDVYEEDPEDGDLIGDKNEDSSGDGDLLGDDDEVTAASETTEESETTDNTDSSCETSCSCGCTSSNEDASDAYNIELPDNATILLKTECDIQQAAKLISSGTIMADFKVFFPCEVGEKLPIRFNTKFRCEDYAIPIQGYVVGFEYSQLGGCHVDIKMNEV